MNRYLIRFVSCLLVPAMLGADPGLASVFSPPPSRPIPAALFTAEAINPALDAGYTPETARRIAISVRQEATGIGFWQRPGILWDFLERIFETPLTRRQWAKVMGGMALIIFAGEVPSFAQTRPAVPTIEEARQYKNLMKRLFAVSPRIRGDFVAIRAHQIALQKAAANDVTWGVTQNDLTHSPRESLTEGPAPTIKDVIGRTWLQVQGPRRRVEMARLPEQRRRNSFWGKVLGGIERGLLELDRLALKGGIQINSKSTILESRMPIYEAGTDLGEADARAFVTADQEWLAVHDAWFDLGRFDIEIARLQTLQRIKRKEMAQNTIAFQQDGNESHRAANQILGVEILELSSRIAKLETEQKLEADALFSTYLKGFDPEKKASAEGENYRPLLPSINPTLAFLDQVLLSVRAPSLAAAARGFREALRGRLGRAAPDPFAQETRAAALDQLWDIPGSRESIPGPDLPSDPGLQPSWPAARRILAESSTPEGRANLLLRADPSPEEARLDFARQRFEDLIDKLKISKLAKWSINIFAKLGLDLPIQLQTSYQKPVHTARVDLAITEQKVWILHVETMLEATSDSNDIAIKAARLKLEGARRQLTLKAQASARALEELTRQMLAPAPPLVSSAGYQGPTTEDQEPENLLQNPLLAFEMYVFDIREATRQLEKDYRRLEYLVEGRREARLLLDEYRDAFLAEPEAPPSTASPSPSAPVKEHPGLDFPSAAPKKSRAVRRAGALLLGGGVLSFAQTTVKPLLQPSFVPDYSMSLLAAGLLGLMLLVPHFISSEDENRTERIASWLMVLTPLAAFAFPFGYWWGGIVALTVAWLSWTWRPEALSTLRPRSLLYRVAHKLDRGDMWRRREWLIKFGLAAVWFCFAEYARHFLGEFSGSAWDLFLRRLKAKPPSMGETGLRALRIPLPYTAPSNGELVHVRLPDSPEARNRWQPAFFVRWIGPDDPIPTDSIFVFRCLNEPLVQASADVKAAQGELDGARESRNTSAIVTAEQRLERARSVLDAEREKLPWLDEPMPRTGLPLEIDRVPSSAAPGTKVTTGQTLPLALQKSSRGAQLQLTLTNEQAATLGAAVGERQRRALLVLKPKEGGAPVLIPAAALSQMRASQDIQPGMSAITRNAGKGSMPQHNVDTTILVTDDLLALVPAQARSSTVDFLRQLNNGDSSAFQATELSDFLERTASGWAPFTRTLEENQVIGWARLDATAAAAAHTTSAPATTQVDRQTHDREMAQARVALEKLRALLQETKGADESAANRRRQLRADIAKAEGALASLREQAPNRAAAVQMAVEENTRIGPRENQVMQDGRWIWRRFPWAGSLNISSQRHSAAALPANAVPEGVMPWTAGALDQVGPRRANILVNTAVHTSLEIGAGNPVVTFPGDRKLPFTKTIGTTADDTQLDFNRVSAAEEFSVEDARALVPDPSSILPVVVTLPAAALAPETKPDYDTIFTGLTRTIAVAAALLAVRAIRLFLRRRNGKHPALTPGNGPSPHMPSYTRETYSANPWNLRPLDPASIDEMTSFFKNTYFPYERENLSESDVLYDQYEHTDLAASHKDHKVLMNYFHHLRNKDAPNRKTTHALIATAVMFVLTLLLLSSDTTFGVIRDAMVNGTPMYQLLISGVSGLGHDLFHLNHSQFIAVLQNDPMSLVNQFVPLLFLLLLIGVILYAIGKGIAELSAPGVWMLRDWWYRRVRKIHDVHRRFMRSTAEITPTGVGIRPGEAARKVRQDAEGIDDSMNPQRIEVIEPYLVAARNFGWFLTERASYNLARDADLYIEECSTLAQYDGQEGFFDTPGRRQASDARWFAAAFRQTARDQNTGEALIPIGTPLQGMDDIRYEDAYLEEIAVNRLHMDRERFSASAAEGDPSIARIRQEYFDRALVFWAVEEMRKHPISTFFVLETYDLTGLAMRDVAPADGRFPGSDFWTFNPTDLRDADRYFNEAARGKVQTALNEFRMRLPTLSKNGHRRRQHYIRQRPPLQSTQYLLQEWSPGQTPDDSIRRLLPGLLIDPSTGESIIEQRTERGIPSPEMVAFDYYQDNLWPEEYAAEIRNAYRRAGMSLSDAEAEISQIRTALDRSEMRLYISWATVRRLMKTNPENSTILYNLLCGHGDPGHRGPYDLRFLRLPAPVMDPNKRNRATIADLLISDLEDGEFLNDVIDSPGTPILGNADLFGDLALEINRQRALKDLSNDVRSLQRNRPVRRSRVPAGIRMAAMAFLSAGGLWASIPNPPAIFMFLHQPAFWGLALAAVLVWLVILYRREKSAEAYLISMGTPLDPMARTLSLRRNTRMDPEQSGNAHILTSRQTDTILPFAGKVRPASILRVAVEPQNFARAIDTKRTDPSLFILAPCNPYLKNSATLIFTHELWLDSRAWIETENDDFNTRRSEIRRYLYAPEMPEKTREAVIQRLKDIHSHFTAMGAARRQEFETRVQETRSRLARMNVRIRSAREWTEDILDDVPAQDDDKSYNTILILYPHVRPPPRAPVEKFTFRPDQPDPDVHIVRLDNQRIFKDAFYLLGDTTWGYGKTQYQVREGASFPMNEDHYQWELRRRHPGQPGDGALLGYRFGRPHTVEIDGQKVPAFYHSWTTIAEPVRGQGLGRHFAEQTRHEMEALLHHQGIIYCNVEDTNIPSVKNIEGQGYKAVGEFFSGFMSRRHPKNRSGSFRATVEPASTRDREEIRNLLQTTYAGHDFTDFDSLDPTDSHYVWRNTAGAIVAVVNAKEMHWSFLRLLFGEKYLAWIDTVLIWLFARLPVMKRIFNLGDLHFLKIGNIAYLPGHAREASLLIEAVMARQNVHTAWGFFTPKSAVYRDLKKAGAFGPTGFLDLIQRTGVRTYAYGLDDGSRRTIDQLHEKLERRSVLSPEKSQAPAGPKRPLFVPTKNLVWWLAPFAGLSALLYGLAHPPIASAAPQAVQLAVQQAASVPIDYVALPGDSWWRISERLFGSGARYHDLQALNPDLVNAGRAIHNPNMVHVFDHIHTRLTAPTPAFHPPTAEMVNMHQIPLSHFQQWLLHPVLTPEIAWVALALLAAGIGLWLLMRYRHSIRRAALVGLTAFGLLTPAPAVPAVGTLELSPPEQQTSWAAKLPAPPPPVVVKLKNKKAQASADYRNARLKDAERAHAATNREVEQLRMEYLALLAQRQAEQLGGKPLASPAPAAHEGKPGLWRRILSPRRNLRRLKLAVKPVANLARKVLVPDGDPGASLGTYDPDLESLRKKIEDLIRTAKRNVVIAERLLTVAGESSSGVEAASERLQKAQAQAESLRQDLLKHDPIKGLDEKMWFENHFDTEKLWNETEAGDSDLAGDLAGVANEAAKGTQPVEGTEGLGAREQSQAAESRLHNAEQTALAHDVDIATAQAAAAAHRALSKEFHYAGFDQEAAAEEEQALAIEGGHQLMPEPDPSLQQRMMRVQVDPLDLDLLGASDPALARTLADLLDRAHAAEEEHQNASREAAENESTWLAKADIARSMGMDPLALYADEHGRLVENLQRVSSARRTLDAADRAFAKVERRQPGQWRVTRTPLPEWQDTQPDADSLENIRSEVLFSEQAAEEPRPTTAGISYFVAVNNEPANAGVTTALLHIPAERGRPATVTVHRVPPAPWDPPPEARPADPPPPAAVIPPPEVKPDKRPDHLGPLTKLSEDKSSPAPASVPWYSLNSFYLMLGALLAFGAALFSLRNVQRSGRFFGILIPFAWLTLTFSDASMPLSPFLHRLRPTPQTSERSLSVSA